jgi:hypothetical protein
MRLKVKAFRKISMSGSPLPIAKDTSRVNDYNYNYITQKQKDTQPSQTCSEGYIFLLLYATVAFLCILGEY